MVFQYADRMEKVKPSPIRELLPLASKPGVITFAGGWPTTETFPLDAIKACADRALDKYKTQALQYGPTEGIAQLRECIAQRMKSYGVEDAAAEDIMLTSGSQQGIEYAAKLLINPGDVVICENPTYTGTIGAFNQYGPKYVPIEMDHDGMKMDALETTDHISDADNLNFLIEKAELENDIRYERLQKKAIADAVKNSVFILTGGPGTGKTTVVRAIIRIFESMGLKIALATPTGRAAKRLSEVTGMEAKTIHRMLEMDFSSETGARFRRDENSLLEEDVILVDEASMIDLFLMEALLRAMRPGARLIMIGDANQLPPVGAGYVFRDIIASDRFSTVELTHIFRQASESLIVTNAHLINQGEHIELTKKDGDFFYLPCTDEEMTSKMIAGLCKSRLPRAYGVSVYDGIQVITPSRKGQNGTEYLNGILQAAMNPASESKREKKFRDIVFREGDKVMQTRNNYDIPWKKNGADGFGVFNGDIGIIREIDLMGQIIRIDFDGRIAEYDFSMEEELELAYAITVHKSQGSEYPIVIFPLYRYTSKLLTRNLFYTAITRAQQMVILVGDGEVANRMIDNNRQTKRYTGLGYWLTRYD